MKRWRAPLRLFVVLLVAVPARAEQKAEASARRAAAPAATPTITGGVSLSLAAPSLGEVAPPAPQPPSAAAEPAEGQPAAAVGPGAVSAAQSRVQEPLQQLAQPQAGVEDARAGGEELQKALSEEARGAAAQDAVQTPFSGREAAGPRLAPRAPKPLAQLARGPDGAWALASGASEAARPLAAALRLVAAHGIELDLSRVDLVRRLPGKAAFARTQDGQSLALSAESVDGLASLARAQGLALEDKLVSSLLKAQLEAGLASSMRLSPRETDELGFAPDSRRTAMEAAQAFKKGWLRHWDRAPVVRGAEDLSRRNGELILGRSQDGRTLFLASERQPNQLIVRALSDRRPDRVLRSPVPLINVHGVWAGPIEGAFSPDGRYAALQLGSHRTVVWDLEKDRIETVAFEMPVHALSADGRYLLNRGSQGESVVYDRKKRRLLTLKAAAPAQSGVFASGRDGKVLLGGQDGVLREFDLETGQLLRSAAVASNGGMELLAVSPDGRAIAAVGRGTIVLMDAAAFREVRQIHIDEDAGDSLFLWGNGWNDVSFSPDGGRVAVRDQSRLRSFPVQRRPDRPHERRALARAAAAKLMEDPGADWQGIAAGVRDDKELASAVWGALAPYITGNLSPESAPKLESIERSERWYKDSQAQLQARTPTLAKILAEPKRVGRLLMALSFLRLVYPYDMANHRRCRPSPGRRSRGSSSGWASSTSCPSRRVSAGPCSTSTTPRGVSPSSSRCPGSGTRNPRSSPAIGRWPSSSGIGSQRIRGLGGRSSTRSTRASSSSTARTPSSSSTSRRPLACCFWSIATRSACATARGLWRRWPSKEASRSPSCASRCWWTPPWPPFACTPWAGRAAIPRPARTCTTRTSAPRSTAAASCPAITASLRGRRTCRRKSAASKRSAFSVRAGSAGRPSCCPRSSRASSSA